MIVPKSYRLSIEGLVRDLRVVEVDAEHGVSIAVLKLATDAELTEAVGTALARLVPADVEVLVMPDGKAQSLLHVVARETRLPCVLARKTRKSYMREPIIDTRATSITTEESHAFCLDADDVAAIEGRKAAIVDDVVSRGGTKIAMEELLKRAGAKATVFMAVGTEGVERDDVISLTHFPVFIRK